MEALHRAARVVDRDRAERELLGLGEGAAHLGEVLPGAEAGIDAEALELIGSVVEDGDGGVGVERVHGPVLAERGEARGDEVVAEGSDVLGEVDQELGSDVAAQHPGEGADL